MKYAKSLKKNDIDATVDNRSEKIGFKIREARLDKLPYMLVVGQQEEADGTVSVRSRYAGNEGTKPLAEFIDANLQRDPHKRDQKRIAGRRKGKIIIRMKIAGTQFCQES